MERSAESRGKRSVRKLEKQKQLLFSYAEGFLLACLDLGKTKRGREESAEEHVADFRS